jgi:hypothetical protein
MQAILDVTFQTRVSSGDVVRKAPGGYANLIAAAVKFVSIRATSSRRVLIYVTGLSRGFAIARFAV